MTRLERMRAIIAAFPTLRDLPFDGDAEAFWQTVTVRCPGSGMRQAALFCITLWDASFTPERVCEDAHGRPRRETQRFDLAYAVRVWDADHRRAFQAWARTLDVF